MLSKDKRVSTDVWFSAHLLQWYSVHKRSLPWRKTKDPYRIWISEIILQQTRVDQGLPYYKAFIEKFPDIKSLAAADERTVLKSWQGLGYYSRARNLHSAAKAVVDSGGKFPEAFKDIIKLKGIGDYTAAAISSICFNEPRAVLDGNVYRVLARFKGINTAIDSTQGKKLFSAIANDFLDKLSPGDYNQAVMEFGALCCKPSNPECDTCILSVTCAAYQAGAVASFPVKTKKVKKRSRYFNYVVIEGDSGSYYQKRGARDIWENMYEPLLIESSKYLDQSEIVNSPEWIHLFGNQANVELIPSESLDHKLTHQTIKARFWKVKSRFLSLKAGAPLKEITEEDMEEIPIPRLIEKYLALDC